MQKMKKIIMLAFIMMFTLSLSIPVSAHEVPDLNRPGTIKVTMQKGETFVNGGTLAIYRVGQIYENNGNYDFISTGDFIDCDESFEDVQSETLAANLAVYAKDNPDIVKAEAVQDVDKDGTVEFTDLDPGLYLVVQTKAAEGYEAAVPFLVSLPYMQDGVYVYDVDASPKVELETSKEPESPDKPTTPSKPSGKLPQTGQMNWPVPIMAITGILLFAIGWILYFGKRETNEK